MPLNNQLKLHFLDVKHGDCTIIEFPDYGSPLKAHFGVVDFGALLAGDMAVPRDYMEKLLDVRRVGFPNFDYEIDFVCVTHPHRDHYGGLRRFLTRFADPANAAQNYIKSFWDCGFRTTASTYNNILANDVIPNNNMVFQRVSAGSEYEFGDVKITIFGPSVDLRNRFDTWGVNMNDSSISLKISYNRSHIIIGGDAQFASWAKVTEEFPRRTGKVFYNDALGFAERKETADQIKCDLLRVSHHGSKHGTSLEYVERMKPNRIIYSAAPTQWYTANPSLVRGTFPHPLIEQIFDELEHFTGNTLDRYVTGDTGHIIAKYSGNYAPVNDPFDTIPSSTHPSNPAFFNLLQNAW